MTASPSTLETQLAGCLKGDRSAQMNVYRAFQKAMYNTALRLVNDVFEAEDITQEAFITAFQSLDQLHDHQRFAGWLKRIVINKSMNRLERNVSFERLDEKLDTIEEPEEEIDHSTTIEEIKTAINKLPSGFRTILNLYLFEGLDHEEIAQVMNISSATSRSQYNRGKKKLITLLKG